MRRADGVTLTLDLSTLQGQLEAYVLVLAMTLPDCHQVRKSVAVCLSVMAHFVHEVYDAG